MTLMPSMNWAVKMTPKTLPQTIDAKKSTLRHLTESDAEPFYRFVSNDDNVRYMFFEEEQRTVEGAKGMIEWVVNAYESDDPVCIYAIADKATGAYMGNLGAQTMEGTDDTEFFYALLPEYRGQGYVTDAVKAFVTYLFDEGIQLAVAIIVPENDASTQVVNRLGARFAGDCLIHGNAGLRYEIDRPLMETWT